MKTPEVVEPAEPAAQRSGLVAVAGAATRDSGTQYKPNSKEVMWTAPKGWCQEFRVGRRFEHQAAMALVKRSPKRTANCAFAMIHSRGPIFHSFSDRFKTRKSSFIAASSLGKCPRARTALRSLELSASMAFVTGTRIDGASVPAGRKLFCQYMVRPSGTGAPGARKCGQAVLQHELRARVSIWPPLRPTRLR